MGALRNRETDLNKGSSTLLDAHAAVYRDDFAANADLDGSLSWIQRSDLMGYGTGLYEFSLERAKTSDREREPAFQERNWPDVKQGLLNDDPIINDLDEELLATGFERSLALPSSKQVQAVQKLRSQMPSATPRMMAHSIVSGTKIGSLDVRKELVDAGPAAFESSMDPAIVFARDFMSSIRDQRQRVRVLNEKILQNRSRFARALTAWKGTTMYPDANFTLRVTYGRVAGYTNAQGKPVPFTTRVGDMFTLAQSRGNKGDFALPHKLSSWRQSMSDADFRRRYASLPVDFVSTNDITGGNSGSATLNKSLEIVGLIFDGNEEGMVSDWTYSEKAGRALSTDIRFALTIAREVHKAGWVVDELLNPDKPLKP